MELEMNRYAAASLATITAILLLMGMAMAQTVTQSTSASVTVGDFLSVTLSNAPIAFPNMNPGTGPTAASNNALTATIGAESNVNADIATEADAPNFTGIGTLPIGQIEWSDALAGTYTGYTESTATVCSAVTPGSDCGIFHQITIPGSLPAGSYSVGITVTATGV